jgi:hypothetical protein
LKSALEDAMQYGLAELGRQFVHYRLNEVVTRVGKTHRRLQSRGAESRPRQNPRPATGEVARAPQDVPGYCG